MPNDYEDIPDSDLNDLSEVSKVRPPIRTVGKDEFISSAEEIRRANSDIKERAMRLKVSGNVPRFPYTKTGRTGAVEVLNNEANRLACFDQLFGTGKSIGKGLCRATDIMPCFDEYHGQLIDWDGNPLVSSPYQVIISRALEEFGMPPQDTDQVMKSLVKWSQRNVRNSFTESFLTNIPKWDGKPRIEMEFANRLKCHDTELNRLISTYFFLSHYMRITRPGCQAPIVIAFIGPQGSGKNSYVDLICKEIKRDPNRPAVTWNWSKPERENLMAATGKSSIIRMPERGGHRKADIKDFKEMVTSTHDTVRFMHSNPVTKARQWIMIADDNEIEGLYRDSTGERRLYPLYWAQLDDDENGQPNWVGKNDKEGGVPFMIDFTGIASMDIDPQSGIEDPAATLTWQTMAECHELIQEKGERFYLSFLNKLVDKVSKFNAGEVKRGRGTVEHADWEMYIWPALSVAPCREVRKTAHKNSRHDGLFFPKAAFHPFLNKMSHPHKVWAKDVRAKIEEMGGKEINLGGSQFGYLFPGVYDFKGLVQKLLNLEDKGMDIDDVIKSYKSYAAGLVKNIQAKGSEEIF